MFYQHLEEKDKNMKPSTNKFSSLSGRVCFLLALWWLFFPILGVMPARPAEAQSPQTFDITLEELGYQEQVLSGPVARVHYYFGLPADWKPLAGGYLELNLIYTVSGQEGYAPALLTVQMNDHVLHTESFETSAGLQLHVDIPPEVWRLPEEEYVNDLRLSLEVHAPCELALLTSLVVQPSSYFRIVYSERPLLTDLALYPKPLYQRLAFEPAQTRFVLSAGPNSADIRAATMIAAKLGALTGDELPFAATLSSDLPSEANEEHLMIIGQPESSPLLRQLDLPLPLTERRLALRSEMPATVVPGQTFSCTLTVKNTSSTAEELVLEDRWPPATTLLACQDECEEIMPNVLRWDIGPLEAGQEISTVLQVRLEPLTPLGESVEHTASLLDKDGNVINVDTLTTTVGTMDQGQTVASDPEKGPYFFARDGHGIAEGDGLIQEIVSPWSPRRAAIVVTGLSDEAILRAGQALGAKTRFPGMSGPYAIVQATQPVSETTARPVEDITFASLGYTDSVLDVYSEGIGYTFYVPRGWALAEDAGLALHFAHGTALSVVSATLEIQLNGVPIYSVLLDEQNVYNAWSTIPMPQSRPVVGPNRFNLQLSADFPECMDIEFAERFWLTIYSDSFLHLPHEKTKSTFDLADFPQPFSDQNDLGGVVFLLPEQPAVTEVEGLLRLASRLGSAARGDAFLPQVALGGDPEKAMWGGYDVIALGRPTGNSYIAAVNDALPQPFIPGTDEFRQQVDHIIYRLPPGYSLGYVQELALPWDEDRVMLVVAGSTDEGVAWAWDVLTNDRLSNQLSGNLAIVVREGEVRATDTRESVAEGETGISYATLIPVMTPEATVTPTPTVTPATATPIPVLATMTPVTTDASVVVKHSQPIWLISLLIVSILAVVVSVGIAIWQARS